MKFGGLDVGRYFDRTTYAELEHADVTDMMQIGSIKFQEQAEFLRPRLRQCYVTVVDVTGVGQGLFEILDDMKLSVLPATIIAGQHMALKDGKLIVGKQFLVQTLSINLSQLSAVNIPEDQKSPLRVELKNFRIKNGKIPKFEARTGHDDRVIALGLALLGVMVYEREIERYVEGQREGFQEVTRH